MTRRSRLDIRNSLSADGGVVSDSELASWPGVDALVLPPGRRDLYLRRERAIRLYLDGDSDVEIRAACQFGRGQVYRILRERCLKQHPDGQIYGWRGLLPHFRSKTYERKSALKPDAAGTKLKIRAPFAMGRRGIR